MIILGALMIFTGVGGPATGFSNLWVHDGFMPNGMWGLMLSLVIVMLSFGGIELIGITAGEAAAQLTFKTPWHPYTNYFCFAFLVMIIVLITQIDGMKMAIYILPA